MGKRLRLILVSGLLIYTILACNLSVSQNDLQTEAAATITALATLQQNPTETLQASTGTPTETTTPTGVQVSVTSTTNCRTGPAVYYDLVLTMNPGQTLQVVGKNTSTNYWIISNPAGGTCWLWGQYAVIAGNTNSLPDYPPPAPPTSKPTRTPKPSPTPTFKFKPFPITLVVHPPSAPTNLFGSRTNPCGSGFNGSTPIWIETYTLTWTDNATNETGYRVYRNGSLVASIAANSTQYTNSFDYDQGTGGPLYDTFGVEAYNNFGPSPRPTWDVNRCP
jgi:hypothetical protein